MNKINGPEVRAAHKSKYEETRSRLVDTLSGRHQLKRMNESTETTKPREISAPIDMLTSQAAEPFLDENTTVFACDHRDNSVSVKSLITNGKPTLLTVSYSGYAAGVAVKWADTFLVPFADRADKNAVEEEQTADALNQNPFREQESASQTKLRNKADVVEKTDNDFPIQVVHIQICESPVLLLVKSRILREFFKSMNPLTLPYIHSLCLFDDNSIDPLQRKYSLKRQGYMSQIFLIDAKGRLRWKASHHPIPREIALLNSFTKQLIETANVDDDFSEERNHQNEKKCKLTEPTEQSLSDAEERVKKVAETLRRLR